MTNLIGIQKYLSIPHKFVFSKEILRILNDLKNKFIEENDEISANQCWIFEVIYDIQEKYVRAFNLLTEKKYEEAWRLYEAIEICLSHLQKHFNYSNNEYNLAFIEKQIHFFQELFPYVHFLSREMTIGKEKCNICDRIITSPRNACEHIVGNLYMGKMCIREALDVELHGFAITQHPKDKYTVLFPEGYEYNYESLEMLLSHIKSPYCRWKIIKIKELKPEYRNIGRNDLCPCGSGKKYKKCCQGKEQEFKTHNHIEISDCEPFSYIPTKEIETWKIKPEKKNYNGLKCNTMILRTK